MVMTDQQANSSPFVIGLTGGIACGKSYIAQRFQDLGAHTLEADDIVRELTQPGEPAYQAIVDYFGSHIIKPDQQLDRPYLRQLIFNHPEHKQWLEQLIHPRVRNTMAQRVQTTPAPYHILVIPLLIENLPNPLIQRIAVVEAPLELQYQRLLQRDHIDEQLAQRIIDQQAHPDKRRQYADDIINSALQPSELNQSIQQLDHYYRQLAQQ